MLAAMAGLLAPVPAAILQEVIDVAVILNALRALTPARRGARRTMPSAARRALRHDHETLNRSLDDLRVIADALDDAAAERATALIRQANALVQGPVVEHERLDEGDAYPRIAKLLGERHGLAAMSRAHREILHLARLTEDLPGEQVDRYLIRDAQRAIESIEALVRIHTAQEEDIYAAVAAG